MSRITKQNMTDTNTPVLLMSPPDFYGIPEPDAINGCANDFSAKGYKEYLKNPKAFRKMATKQWNDLKGILLDVGAKIEEVEPHEDCPDIVFTADPTISLVEKQYNKIKEITLLSRFSNIERQDEVISNLTYFRKQLPNRPLVESHYRTEGSGDNVYDSYRDLYWSGYSSTASRKNAASGRSDIRAHAALSAITGVEVVSLSVVRPFFHIDTALAPLSNGHMVFYEGGISSTAKNKLYQKAFRDFGMDEKKYVIPVSKKDADKLACNLVCFGDTLVMAECSDDLQGRIKKAGYKIITTDVSAFIFAGGAVHCLTNNINQQRQRPSRTKVFQGTFQPKLCR